MTKISVALLGLFLVACGGASVSSSELGEEGSPRLGADSSLEAGSPSPVEDSSQDAGAPSPSDDSSLDDGTSPSDREPLEGQSSSHAVFWVGHSLTGFKMPQMVGEIAESLGLTYSWNAQIGTGAPLVWNWDNSTTTPQVDSRSVLPEGGYDVLVLTEALPLINHTTWSDTSTYAGLFHDLVAGQPGAQTYLYETWHCLDTGTPAGCAYDEHDDVAWRPRLDQDHSRWQGIVDAVNQDRSGPAMKLAPVGQAMAALYDEIEAGNMPGLTGITDVFADDIHPNTKGFYFIALVHTAVIYGVDVRGAAHAFNDQYGSAYPDLPSQGLATAMQNLVWDVIQ